MNLKDLELKIAKEVDDKLMQHLCTSQNEEVRITVEINQPYMIVEVFILVPDGTCNRRLNFNMSSLISCVLDQNGYYHCPRRDEYTVGVQSHTWKFIVELTCSINTSSSATGWPDDEVCFNNYNCDANNLVCPQYNLKPYSDHYNHLYNLNKR